jgi:hypothetical protein
MPRDYSDTSRGAGNGAFRLPHRSSRGSAVAALGEAAGHHDDGDERHEQNDNAPEDLAVDGILRVLLHEDRTST